MMVRNLLLFNLGKLWHWTSSFTVQIPNSYNSLDLKKKKNQIEKRKIIDVKNVKRHKHIQCARIVSQTVGRRREETNGCFVVQRLQSKS